MKTSETLTKEMLREEPKKSENVFNVLANVVRPVSFVFAANNLFVPLINLTTLASASNSPGKKLCNL